MGAVKGPGQRPGVGAVLLGLGRVTRFLGFVLGAGPVPGWRTRSSSIRGRMSRTSTGRCASCWSWPSRSQVAAVRRRAAAGGAGQAAPRPRHRVVRTAARRAVLALSAALRHGQEDGRAAPDAPGGGMRSPFEMPGHTTEDFILRQFSALGKVVAVGQPGEELPLLGARRGYLPLDDWKAPVSALLQGSHTVLLSVAPGPGTEWEFTEALRTVAPERFVLMVACGAGEYDAFRRGVAELYAARRCQEGGSAGRPSPICRTAPYRRRAASGNGCCLSGRSSPSTGSGGPRCSRSSSGSRGCVISGRSGVSSTANCSPCWGGSVVCWLGRSTSCPCSVRRGAREKSGSVAAPGCFPADPCCPAAPPGSVHVHHQRAPGKRRRGGSGWRLTRPVLSVTPGPSACTVSQAVGPGRARGGAACPAWAEGEDQGAAAAPRTPHSIDATCWASGRLAVAGLGPQGHRRRARPADRRDQGFHRARRRTSVQGCPVRPGRPTGPPARGWFSPGAHARTTVAPGRSGTVSAARRRAPETCQERKCSTSTYRSPTSPLAPHRLQRRHDHLRPGRDQTVVPIAVQCGRVEAEGGAGDALALLARVAQAKAAASPGGGGGRDAVGLPAPTAHPVPASRGPAVPPPPRDPRRRQRAHPLQARHVLRRPAAVLPPVWRAGPSP